MWNVFCNYPTIRSIGRDTKFTVFHFLSTHADRHVVDISFTVCLFVCPQDFGNGYLGRGLA